MFNLPAGFQPTDEYAKSNLGMSLADYYQRNPGAQQAWNTSSANPQNSPSAIAAQQAATAKAASDAQNAAQEQKINDFTTKFQSAVGALPTVQQSASDIGNSLGLPNLQKNAQTLTANVAAIPTIQTNATRGYNVDSNQLSQIIASKEAQLAPVAQTAVTQEQNAEGAVNTQLGYVQQQNQLTLQPIETEGTMLSSQIAAEMTGFNQQQQGQLQTYLDALDNNEKLTQDQLDDAEKLAESKVQYDSVKQQLTSVSAGNSLYNPQGQLVATAPTALKATASPWG